MELISLSISDQPASTHEPGSAETDESRVGKIPNIESIPITAHLGRKCLDTTEHMGTTHGPIGPVQTHGPTIIHLILSIVNIYQKHINHNVWVERSY